MRELAAFVFLTLATLSFARSGEPLPLLIENASQAVATEPAVQTENGDMPPTRFRGPATFTLSVVGSQDELERHCSKAAPGWVRRGCVRQSWTGEVHVFLPDSCPYGDRGEHYARYICHEIGHIRGWRH